MVDIWDARHKAFHNAIASGCGSRSLLQARAFLQDQAERYRQIWLKRTVLSEEALRLKREEHAELVIVTLKSGEKVTVGNFFAVDQAGVGSDMVFVGEDGTLWHANYDAAAFTGFTSTKWPRSMNWWPASAWPAVPPRPGPSPP